MNTLEIEVAVAKMFDYRSNLIVPNVSWGLGFKYEIDVLVLTPSDYAYEIEIKISASDLRRDKLKANYHNSDRIKRLYFAVPDKLRDLALTEIPSHAGLITVEDLGQTRLVRHPQDMKAKKFTASARNHLHQLSSMRTWTLKESAIYQMQRNMRNKKVVAK